MMPGLTIYDSQGQLLRLESEIGRGGEGSVWKVAGMPGRVAKLYHAATAEQSAKIGTMVGLQTERLLKIAAWPVETLHAGPRRAVRGFLMPHASGRQIHILYGPKSRLTGFPQATWPFLLQAAANLARAFTVVHEHGLVVGDVNHANSLVSDQATVALIDCDSFQLTNGERSFYCGVGVETHLPPELQGQDLSRVLRTRNHDAFGLAVLVFQILFMGRHPFSGRFLGPGDMPIAKAIREFRFAYGPGAGARQMQQPPNTLTLEAVSSEVARLFERAFSVQGVQQGSRPVPQDWVAAIESLSGRLQICGRNPSHHYLRGLEACPWCEIEGRSGVLMFGIWWTTPKQSSGSFQLTAVWAQITAVASPGTAPSLPDPKALRAKPARAAVWEAWRYRGRIFLAVCCGFGGAGLSLLAGNAALIFIFVSLWLAIAIGKSGSYPLRDKARVELKEAEAEVRRLMAVWNREASAAHFEAKLRELEQRRATYVDLPAARLRRLAQLQANLRQKQLERFLDQHRLARTKIRGIGTGRLATLQSYGIETAADLDSAAIHRIPGFGPAMVQNLMGWKLSIERAFSFDPKRGIDPADLRALDNDLASQKAQLERDLAAGAAQLVQTRRAIEARRQTLFPQITAVIGRVAHAQADLRAL